MDQQPVTNSKSDESPGEIEIDLKDPALAAFLAWLVPGAGHFYQRRTAKGILFSTCILGTFLFGMMVGDGRVVYAQWQSFDKRWPYFCQFPAGAVSLPALVQNMRGDHLFGDKYAPPDSDTLHDLNYDLNHRFEIGTVYTMIAGLLNVLAIYDAWGGPVIIAPREKKKKKGWFGKKGDTDEPPDDQKEAETAQTKSTESESPDAASAAG